MGCLILRLAQCLESLYQNEPYRLPPTYAVPKLFPYSEVFQSAFILRFFKMKSEISEIKFVISKKNRYNTRVYSLTLTQSERKVDNGSQLSPFISVRVYIVAFLLSAVKPNEKRKKRLLGNSVRLENYSSNAMNKHL